MEDGKRRMAFWEVGKGELGRQVQQAFEDAQRISTERGVNTAVKLHIDISKPSEEALIRQICFSVDIKQPAKVSKIHDTVLSDGIAVRDSETPLEQLELVDSCGNAVDFTKRKAQ